MSITEIPNYHANRFLGFRMERT